jgi:hypothetical protein
VTAGPEPSASGSESCSSGPDASDDHALVFEPGQIVRVRAEAQVSEVVLPTHRWPDHVPHDVPDVEVCCVPQALVRTPVGSGKLRWIELCDLASAEDDRGAPGSAGLTPA